MAKDDAYRDGTDADDVSTAAAAQVGPEQVAAELAALNRAFAATGQALLDATDALLRSPFPDSLDVAALLAALTDHLTERRDAALHRVVVRDNRPAREVAKRLGWTPARVAFACRGPRQR